MSFSWRYERKDGSIVESLPSSAATGTFPSQAEAEAWLGETWQELLAAGVDAVTLFTGERVIYGPMSLHPAP